MTKRIIIITVLLISLLLSFVAGCSQKASTTIQPFEVKRGDLNIIVSSDGSLTMPDNFDLRFGTTGKIQTILVEEGDKVKEGALLAFLGNTAQKNAIRTALFNIQSAVNDIAVICGVQTDLPYNYPELSAVRIFEQAQYDIDECISYFKQGQYKEAGFKLAMTYFDIEVCEDLIATRPNATVYAGAKSNSVIHPDDTAGSEEDLWPNDPPVVNYLQQYRGILLNISNLLMQGAYEEIIPALESARAEMLNGKKLVENTVHIRGRTYLTYPDIPTSLNFLQASIRSMQELEKGMTQGNNNSEEITRILYTAILNLAIGHDTLENQTLTFDWNSGSNWKTLQQYNLNVQSAEIALAKAKRDIMNTVIIAPSNGIVVSIDLKQGYVLSAQDYSSRTAIKLVNTEKIKFNGLVDEIDIMKVQTGQKAEIAVDALPGKIIAGTVKFISPFGTNVGQVVKFAVTVELDPTDAQLRGGLSATADINIYSAKDVLLVPVSAISFTPSGPMVTIINETTGQTEQREVTLGKQTFEFAEVLAGLKEGEKVRGASQKPTSTQSTTSPGQPMPPPR
jgi:multidrug efflux pump subunit AcrA (membrane-fusion protein)